MKKLVISNSSHWKTKENNNSILNKLNDIIFSEVNKRVFNYFNSDKIYIDDTNGFISIQPTSQETFYKWLTKSKIDNIVKFINKYVEDDSKGNPTIWIGNYLVQE